jgi:IS5 family transposase
LRSCGSSAARQGKTAYNRKKARRNYLKVAKQRKSKLKATRRAIGEQLDYVGKNLETLNRLRAEVGENRLRPADKERLATIEKVHEQQRFMHDTGTHSCPDRIVSLRQPHVRCIVRGKAGRPYEFGQKLHLSVVNGFTFIEDQSYDNYNEEVRLQAAVERYKDRFGHYPEAVLADTIYRNRENRVFCKEHSIRLSGPKLGRPRKDGTEENDKQAYKNSSDRNMVESRNGIGKRRYGLDLIMAYLAETGKTVAAFIILAMNVAHLLRLLLRLFGTCWQA